jgi:endonuclease/exonuclease/phosphatase family metal-dependent hydrolase
MRTISLLGVLFVLPLLGGSGEVHPAPELLTFDELLTLSATDQPPQPLAGKLATLLATPFVNNASEVGPHRPVVEGLGPVVRVVSWNIERGLNFDLIRMALSDPHGFQQRIAPEPGKHGQIERQLEILREADVVVLNEVDLGMKRTDYRDVAHDLARALGMNFVFGVEFIELDPLEDLGTEKVALQDPQLTGQMQEELTPDPARYKGLHGNAILSRYPIANARIVRLPVCHDWYAAERADISRLEKGKRAAANTIFLERIEREVRQGGRMALIADLQIPGLRTGTATVVNAHLESKCSPQCRAKQMDALLAQLKTVANPVILAGDLNTSGTDGQPTSIRSELMKRIKNYEFWVTTALKWGTPASLPLAAVTPVQYYKTYLDPTSRHFPIVAANKEAGLFRRVEKFRFDDRMAFDFRGEPDRNENARGRTLANSNERARKGFEPTFTLKRDFGGLVGRYKLDWVFVKSFTDRSRRAGMSHEFAPHFPITMRELNNSVPDGISDHAPISVDLPLENPR